MASIHSRHVRREVGYVHEARRRTEGVGADNGGYRPVPSHGDLKPLHRYNQTGGAVYVDLVMALSSECGIPSYPGQPCNDQACACAPGSSCNPATFAAPEITNIAAQANVPIYIYIGR